MMSRDSRMAILRHNVAADRDNWAVWAKPAAIKRSNDKLLMDLADAIVNRRALTDAERFFLSNALMQVASGNNVRKALRITPAKLGHRPKSMLRHAVATEVACRVAEGDALRVAIKGVADGTGLDTGKVRDDWKSFRARNTEKE